MEEELNTSILARDEEITRLREALEKIADRYHNSPESFTYRIAMQALEGGE